MVPIIGDQPAPIPLLWAKSKGGILGKKVWKRVFFT